ncbi:MAG: CoA transferase [Chloroflexi bacterium]|nr:CoA transferase [Chloroflexota bacterium]
MSASPLPLEGVRVTDFTWVLAGPYAKKLLADFGALVIKDEDREGRDLARRLPPFPGRQEGVNRSGYYNNLNRNKLSISLNLRDPRGQETARSLAAISDLVIENFSAGVMERLGLDYPSLRRVKPDIVYVSMAGLGQQGPWRNYVSYGPIIQALSGLTFLTGYPDRMPTGVGYSYADFVGGLNGAYAALAALHHRRRTGRGQYIDLSQLEAACTFVGPGLLDWLVNRRPQQRTANHLAHIPAAPHGVYRCRGDDRWCAISVFTQGQWQALCTVMGNPEWCQEERFGTPLERVKHQGELDRLLEGWASARTAEEVAEALQAAGVPAAPVQSAREMLEEDPQLKARGFYVGLEHPELGRRLFEGTPLRFTRTEGGPRQAAPLLGQHNDLVYSSLLGLPEEQLNQLIVDEVV